MAMTQDDLYDDGIAGTGIDVGSPEFWTGLIVAAALAYLIFIRHNFRVVVAA